MPGLREGLLTRAAPQHVGGPPLCSTPGDVRKPPRRHPARQVPPWPFLPQGMGRICPCFLGSPQNNFLSDQQGSLRGKGLQEGPPELLPHLQPRDPAGREQPWAQS